MAEFNKMNDGILMMFCRSTDDVALLLVLRVLRDFEGIPQMEVVVSILEGGRVRNFFVERVGILPDDVVSLLDHLFSVVMNHLIQLIRQADDGDGFTAHRVTTFDRSYDMTSRFVS